MSAFHFRDEGELPDDVESAAMAWAALRAARIVELALVPRRYRRDLFVETFRWLLPVELGKAERRHEQRKQGGNVVKLPDPRPWPPEDVS